MYKGFYNLTSGMLSQGRRLDVISNNMTNLSTAGYKSDIYTDSTFREHMVSRVGNKDKTGTTEIGGGSYILAPSALYTDYTQGVLEPTGIPLDFAIEGDGFFAINAEGGVAYSRSGSFTLDDEGYLTLPGMGRVRSAEGAEIQLGTDDITADNHGNISVNGEFVAKLGVFSFPDNGALVRNERGLFTGAGAQAVDSTVRWQMEERSNVVLIDQMVNMITAQRALQSAAQISKMYDQVIMNKSANDIGRV